MAFFGQFLSLRRKRCKETVERRLVPCLQPRQTARWQQVLPVGDSSPAPAHSSRPSRKVTGLLADRTVPARSFPPALAPLKIPGRRATAEVLETTGSPVVPLARGQPKALPAGTGWDAPPDLYPWSLARCRRPLEGRVLVTGADTLSPQSTTERHGLETACQ